MKINDRWGQVCAVAAMSMLIGAGAVMAQVESGNLYGKVKDEKGAALRDVTVTLDTGEAPQVQVTNAKGEFHFLGLAPATYTIKAEKQDYSPVEDGHIVIAVGRNTDVDLTMSLGVVDRVVVLGDSPVLDPAESRKGVTVSLAELQKVPTARDPWTVLQGTPGVLVDRVNVGGNQSGQQSTYVGPGSFGTQSVWSVDGVVITDMSATGSTPAYYDFDSFQEMQISTGGSDSTIATGGVVLNIVTKRGTNDYRGSARYLQVPGGTESKTTFTASDVPAAQRPTFAGGSNKINKVEDYGGEVGGPILKDHLWLWGAYGEQQVSVQTLPKIVPGNPALSTPNGLTDKTKLPAWNAKLSAQVSDNNSLTFVGMNSAKEKQGRNAGPTRPQETTWNQGQFGGKPTLLKGEDSQIFSPNLYLTVLYSHVYGGFFLLPQSGTGADVPAAFRDGTTTWHNSFVGIEIKRPQTQEKADASTFFSTGSLSHELKYGAAYRVATSVTSSGWPGGGYILSGALTGTPPPQNYLVLARAAVPRTSIKYGQAYVQDTMTAGNLTTNVGIRYDRQGGDNGADSVQANSIRPDLLPATAFGGGPIGFTWETWSPRVGLTYALGRDHTTLLRASYSRFADQLGTAQANWLNPFRTNSYYYAYTTNQGNGHLTPGQVQQVG
ncbi:MAG: TonB-dependent receptor, partial [Acidobacteria bacterium]|nr:TonB-dependent receptor [Acidobacteriota bacterium]